MTTVNGLVVMTPTSIVSTGTGNSSSINADGSVDFSSCATLSLNGVFTSSYDNYMIVVRHLGSVDWSTMQARLRLSGTDNTTASSYISQQIEANNTSISGGRFTQSHAFIVGTDDTQRSGATIYLFGPGLSQSTAFRGLCVSGKDSAFISEFAGTHNQSTAYDGITLYPASGSFTGLLTVFGFNQ